MITDADVKKLKAVFATKEELKSLNSKMDLGFIEIIQFIGEVKSDIMKELNNFRQEVNVFRGEVNEFRNEMRDINRNSQSTLNNHESRITHLEYINKTS